MTLPRFLQPYLASYDLSRLNTAKDRDVIIPEILNKGDEKALLWLTRTYSAKTIKEAVFFPIEGLWMESVLRYWLKIFGVKLHPQKFRRAILNLNP